MAAIQRIIGDVRHVPQAALSTLSWWGLLQERLPGTPSSFRDIIRHQAALGVDVGGCHGDFGPHNLVVAKGQLWAFDWECAAPDGPTAADDWSFRLAQDGEAAVTRRAVSGPSGLSSSFVWACAYALSQDAGGLPSLVSRWDAIF